MALLAVRGITLRFGGVVALDGVSFDVQEGHIAGLIGNGPRETMLPRFYRAPGAMQALAPNLVARLVARRGSKHG